MASRPLIARPATRTRLSRESMTRRSIPALFIILRDQDTAWIALHERCPGALQVQLAGLGETPGELSRVALQIIQIVLAIGSVAAFASLQLGFSQPHDASFLITNLICSGGLVVIAILTFQLGFVITNGLWVVVSASSLVMLARRHRKA